MNWLDFIIAGVALVGLLIGWRMGLLGAIFNAIGIVVGIFVAARFSDDISAWFTEQGASDAIATVLAYVAIIVGVFVGAQVAKSIAKKMLSMVFLGWIDTLGSVVVGMVFGALLAGAVILGVARFSSDVPQEGVVGLVTGGFRGNIQDALVESSLVPVFIDITDSLPGNALGFIPGDFRVALDQLKERIDQEQ